MPPDQKRVLQDAFRLQRLLKERQVRRFEQWLRGSTPDIDTLKSLSSISERLDKGWSDAEEDAVSADSAYLTIVREIEELQSAVDSELLTVPLQALEKDSQYREARLALAERVKVFQKRLNL